MPLVPDYIAALRPYVPGRSVEDVRRQYQLERIVKLASNENPLGPSSLAVAAVGAALAASHRYPDGGLALRAALARRFQVKVENVVVGSGSEGIMANVIRTFLCDEDEVLTTEAAFIGFRVLAQSRGVRYRTVPYRDWRYDLPALADAINERTKLVYVANPNNPTGPQSLCTHIPRRTTSTTGPRRLGQGRSRKLDVVGLRADAHPRNPRALPSGSGVPA